MDEVGRLLSAIAETRERGGRAALATVVRVRGSAYRREGTKMLIGEDGSQVCMISGGCLEQEVGEIARQVLASGVPTMQHFDLDEDVMWGLGIGCGGSLDVYIEPFDDGAAYGRWHEAVETQRAACLATVIKSSAEAFVPVGARLFVGEDGTTSGGVHAELDPILEEQAGVVMAQLYPAARTEAYRTPDGVTLEVFLDVTVPPPELVLFGAGHDAIPLARLADQLGFKVSVVDPRHAFVTAERFPPRRTGAQPPGRLPRGGGGPAKLRDRHEPPPRARPTCLRLRHRFRSPLHRRARPPVALRADRLGTLRGGLQPL